MRIVFIIDALDSINGGSERQIYILIKGLITRGHQIELCLLRHTPFTRSLTEFPCPVHCLDVERLFSLTSLIQFWRFRKKVIANKVDIVQGFFNDVAMILPFVLWGIKVKTYTSRRDMGIWYTKTRLMILRSFRYSKTKIICNSHAVADYVNKMEWKPRKSILIIHNGIDLENFIQTRDETEFKLEKKSNTFNIVLVANIRPVKKIEELIKAAHIIQNEQFMVHYYIVGNNSDPVYFNSLQKLISQYNLKPFFHFLGMLKEPRYILPQFDLGVLTSQSEGFSNTLMEYMAAGLPIIATRVGGNSELIVQKRNGLLYQAGDEHELAQCIRKVLMNDQLRKNVSLQNKEAIKRFDHSSMVERYILEYSASKE